MCVDAGVIRFPFCEGGEVVGPVGMLRLSRISHLGLRGNCRGNPARDFHVEYGSVLLGSRNGSTPRVTRVLRIAIPAICA